MSYLIPSDLTLISSQNASSSTNINFTSGISTNFTEYKIRILNLVSATDNVNLQMLYSTDGGANYLSTNYLWSYYTLSSLGVASGANSASDSKFQLASIVSNSSSHGIDIDLDLFNLSNASLIKNYRMNQCFYDITANNHEYSVWGAGVQTATTAITAIRFQMSSGNISSGTFLLYGVTL